MLDKRKQDLTLFFVVIATVSLAIGFSDGLFSNYFKDVYNVDGFHRGLIEFPRELPGVIIFFLVSLVSFLGRYHACDHCAGDRRVRAHRARLFYAVFWRNAGISVYRVSGLAPVYAAAGQHRHGDGRAGANRQTHGTICGRVVCGFNGRRDRGVLFIPVRRVQLPE